MNDFDPISDHEASRPRCAPAQDALQRLLDGEPSWDSSEAVDHRAVCVDCREELALAQSMSRAMRPAVVPGELAERVLSAAVKSQRRRRMAYSLGVGGAIAASIMAAVIAVLPTSQTVTERPSSASIRRPNEEPVASKPLGDTVVEARDALVSLTRRTATDTRDNSVGLIPNPKLPEMPGTSDGLEPLAEAQSGAARSVEPITTSARRALSVFLRAADPPNKAVLQ